MSTQVAAIEFNYAPDAPSPAPDAQHAAAVKSAQDFLTIVTADPATPAAVVDYAKTRLAALTAIPGPAPVTPSPAPAAAPPATLTVSAQDLERMIESAQSKLQSLKAEGYVLANKKQAQQQIDALTAGIAGCDVSIARFDLLIEQALAQLDALIETPPAIAMFGVPLVSDANARVQAQALAFAQLRRARFQQRQSRATLESRLADLQRIQAR